MDPKSKHSYLYTCSTKSKKNNEWLWTCNFKHPQSQGFIIIVCHLYPMPLLQPTLMSNVLKLEQKFIIGYKYEDTGFYVLVINNHMVFDEVTSKLIDLWSTH